MQQMRSEKGLGVDFRDLLVRGFWLVQCGRITFLKQSFSMKIGDRNKKNNATVEETYNQISSILSIPSPWTLWHSTCGLCSIYIVFAWLCAHSLQSCPILCSPIDCSPPGSSVHEILQARILERVAMLSSRGSSQPKDWTHISWVSCIAGEFFIHWATWGSPHRFLPVLFLVSNFLIHFLPISLVLQSISPHIYSHSS